jgi:hypothetical protein
MVTSIVETQAACGFDGGKFGMISEAEDVVAVPLKVGHRQGSHGEIPEEGIWPAGAASQK